MSARDAGSPSPPARWTSLVDELRQDHTHGASWLARRAADILADCAHEALSQADAARNDPVARSGSGAAGALDDMAALAWALAWARPSMAAIANSVAAIWRQALPDVTGAAGVSGMAAIERLRMEAERQRESWARVADELARQVSPLLRNPVLTLSRSGSVEHALTAAARDLVSGAPLEVIIAESRPGGEGVALGAALAATGALVTVVPDSAVGVAMARAGALLLGADSVRSDGAVVNKVGSYPAALVAADLGIPVYTLCERLKITPTSYPLLLEHEPSEDNTSRASGEWMWESWLFDVTPARLITSVVTEEGALSQEEIGRIAAQREAGLGALRSLVEHARPLQPDHPE
jgi:translation initiation factor 2B subunit (eIF-2B alpha/beta/delta family)